MTVLIHSRTSSRNGPLFQPSDQLSGFKFLQNAIYFSLYIFRTCSLPEVLNYNIRESKVGYAHFHLDSSQSYQLDPSLGSPTALCKQSSSHVFHWGDTKGYSHRAVHQQWDTSPSGKLFTGHVKGGQRRGLMPSSQIHKQWPKYHCLRRNGARAKLPPMNLGSQYLCSR